MSESISQSELSAADFVDPNASISRIIWCWLFHGKYRKPTGRRVWNEWYMDREVICEKCGLRDRDTERMA